MSEPAPGNEQRFYMIWNPQGRHPTAKHPTIHTARDEAQRLATENPGQRFVILMAVEFMEAVRPVTHAAYDDIPF